MRSADSLPNLWGCCPRPAASGLPPPSGAVCPRQSGAVYPPSSGAVCPPPSGEWTQAYEVHAYLSLLLVAASGVAAVPELCRGGGGAGHSSPRCPRWHHETSRVLAVCPCAGRVCVSCSTISVVHKRHRLGHDDTLQCSSHRHCTAPGAGCQWIMMDP